MLVARNIFKIIFAASIIFSGALCFAFGEATFSITQSPENPNPGENVFLSVSAFEFDVDLAQIVWSVDGKTKDTGQGHKNFSIIAPAGGQSNVVDVKIIPQNGQAIEKSVTISSGGVDLIWETVDGYAPPFYEGKILPIKQSQVRVVAIPNVKSGANSYAKSSSFVYNWKKDGTNVPSVSGFGKDSLVFANQILDTSNRIDVAATDGVKKVNGSIVITPFSPEILFYENNPDIGVLYQTALQNTISINKSKIGIVAEPFFLNKFFKKDSDTTLDWEVNQQKVNPIEKNSIIISADKSGAGFSLSAKYNETKKLFRNFADTININISK